MCTYRNLGLKSEWLKIFFEDPSFFSLNARLGKDMIQSFKLWGKDAELLNAKYLPMPCVARLVNLGVDSLKVWGYLFVNLAYNSNLMNFFVKGCRFNEWYDNATLVKIFDDGKSLRTKQGAVRALKSFLRYSPVGNEMGQGNFSFSGKNIVGVMRTPWQNPEPLVILYSLYRFVAHVDNLFSFTLSELLDDERERAALSPQALFGLDKNILRPLLQGLATNYFSFISVDFNKGLMENIFLNPSKTAHDVVNLF